MDRDHGSTRAVRLLAGAFALALGLAGLSVGAAAADPGGQLELTDDPTSYQVQVGTTREIGWALTNTGDVPVSIPAPPTVTGADWSLSLDDPSFDCGQEITTLAPGERCGVRPHLTPSSVGERPGQLRIDSDAAGSPLVRDLRGAGIPYDALTPDEDRIDFGTVTTTTPSSGRHVVLTNRSSSPTTISAPRTTGPFTWRPLVGCFSESPGPVTLQYGQSCDLLVQFRPVADGPASGSFVVDTDSSQGPETVTLSGVGGPTGPIPAITSVTPPSGPGGTLVRLRGTDLSASSRVLAAGQPVPFTAAADGRTLSLRMPANGSAAYRTQIELQTATGIQRTAPFDYTPQPAPAVTGITPDRGPTTATTPVTLAGTGFVGVRGVDVATDTGVAQPTYTVNDAGTVLRFRVPRGLEPGPARIVVYTEAGASDPVTFTVTAQPAPVVTAVSPASGPARGNTAVRITGTDLTGATVTVGGTGVPATVNAAGTAISLRTPAHAAGTVPVVVTTATGSATTAYTYVQPAPVITGITPTGGPARGNTAVRITGTDLTGATVTVGGAGVPATVNGAGTALSLRAPAHAAGTVPVVVTTAAGSATTAYTYR